MDAFSVLRWYLSFETHAFRSGYHPLLLIGIAALMGLFWVLRCQAFCFRSILNAIKGAGFPLLFLFMGGGMLLFPTSYPHFFREHQTRELVLMKENPLDLFAPEQRSLSSMTNVTPVPLDKDTSYPVLTAREPL